MELCGGARTIGQIGVGLRVLACLRVSRMDDQHSVLGEDEVPGLHVRLQGQKVSLVF